MKYLTIEDLCEMLSISRRTLERMRSPNSKTSNKNLKTKNTIRGTKNNKVDSLLPPNIDRTYFPDPDIYIGKSPRWEEDNLFVWLKENGHLL